jgi:hypothetical protein
LNSCRQLGANIVKLPELHLKKEDCDRSKPLLASFALLIDGSELLVQGLSRLQNVSACRAF